ncbi:hypothetical protein SK128_010222, partial [Halocaridina rubra]
GASPNPPLWCPTTAVPASKQLKLSVLDGNRSFDLVNAKPARYHCTSLLFTTSKWFISSRQKHSENDAANISMLVLRSISMQ